MPEQLRSIEHADWSGGINAMASPYKIGKTQVWRALNFILDEDGALTVRPGLKTIDTAPDGVTKILTLQNLILPDGLVPLAITRRGLAQELYRRTDIPWPLLGTFGTRYDTPTILTWLNQAFIAAGYEVPWKTNGGAMTQLSGSPLATPAAPTVTTSDTPLDVPTAPTVTPGGTVGVTTYSYVIVALNDFGSTPHSPAGTTTTGNAILSASNYNLITWDAVQGATAYQIFRTVGGGTQGLIAQVDNTQGAIADTGLVGNGAVAPTIDTTTGQTTYSYVITAFNANGETVGSSAGTLTNGNPALSSTHYNTLTWTAVPGATGYRIYRTVGGSTQGKIAEVTTGLSLLDTGLQGDGSIPPATGTTSSVVPGAQWLVIHQNAMWAWNTAATTSAYDGPSSLRQSDIDNPDSWPTSFQLFISKDDGQQGTGLGVFTIAETGISPTNVLIAFKDYSSYQITGLFTISQGQLLLPTITKIQTDMGCSAGRTIQFLPGYGIMRLTHRGFALYNGLNDVVASDAIRPYIFGHDDVAGIAWGGVHASTATQVQNPPLYICACPMDDVNQSTRVFVYDLMRQAWTICTFPVPFATLNLLFSIRDTPLPVAGSNNGRQVFHLFQNERDDDGTPIGWSVRFPPFAGLLRRVYIRRCLLQIYRILPFQAIDATFVLGPAQSPQMVQQTTTVATGADTFQGAPTQRLVEDEALFDVGRTGEGCAVELSGRGFLSIRGLTYHVRVKPLTRPMRF